MNRMIRMTIVLVVELGITAIVQWLRIPVWTLVTISDSLFIVGVILLLSSFVMFSGAYRAFSGFNYVARTFFSSHYREMYPHYHDYVEAKEIKKASPIWLEMTIISALMVIASFILGSM